MCKRKGKKQRGRNGDIVLEATTQVIRNELEKEKKGRWRYCDTCVVEKKPREKKKKKKKRETYGWKKGKE